MSNYNSNLNNDLTANNNQMNNTNNSTNNQNLLYASLLSGSQLNNSTSTFQNVPVGNTTSSQDQSLNVSNGYPYFGSVGNNMNPLTSYTGLSGMMSLNALSDNSIIRNAANLSGQSMNRSPQPNDLSGGSSPSSPMMNPSLDAMTAAAVQMEVMKHLQYVQALTALYSRLAASPGAANVNGVADGSAISSTDMTAMMNMLGMNPYMLQGGVGGMGGLGLGLNTNATNMTSFLSPMLAASTSMNMANLQAMISQSNMLNQNYLLQQQAQQIQQQQQQTLSSGSNGNLKIPEPLQFQQSPNSYNNNMKNLHHSSSSNFPTLVSNSNVNNHNINHVSVNYSVSPHRSFGTTTTKSYHQISSSGENISSMSSSKNKHQSSLLPVVSSSSHSNNNSNSTSNNTSNKNHNANMNCDKSKRTVDYQRQVVENFFQEGMSIRIFCKKYDLAPTTFCRWKNKYLKVLNAQRNGLGSGNSGLLKSFPSNHYSNNSENANNGATNYLHLLGATHDDDDDLIEEDDSDDDLEDDDEDSDTDSDLDNDEVGDNISGEDMMDKPCSNDNVGSTDSLDSHPSVNMLPIPNCIDEEAEHDTWATIQQEAQKMIKDRTEINQNEGDSTINAEITKSLKEIIRKVSFDAVISSALRRHVLPSEIRVEEDDIRELMKYFIQKLSRHSSIAQMSEKNQKITSNNTDKVDLIAANEDKIDQAIVAEDENSGLVDQPTSDLKVVEEIKSEENDLSTSEIDKESIANLDDESESSKSVRNLRSKRNIGDTTTSSNNTRTRNGKKHFGVAEDSTSSVFLTAPTSLKKRLKTQ